MHTRDVQGALLEGADQLYRMSRQLPYRAHHARASQQQEHAREGSSNLIGNMDHLHVRGYHRLSALPRPSPLAPRDAFPSGALAVYRVSARAVPCDGRIPLDLWHVRREVQEEECVARLSRGR